MAEHTWYPAEVERDCYGDYQCAYRNELGEEFVYIISEFSGNGGPHGTCWHSCSGDWPGCKADCPLWNIVENDWSEMKRKSEKMPPYDPFNFMLNRTEDIDERNFYVESFDTLDGTHWEISVDIEQQLLDQLDEETEEDEGSVESEEDEENM